MNPVFGCTNNQTIADVTDGYFAAQRKAIADALVKKNAIGEWLLKRVKAYRGQGDNQDAARRKAWADYERLKEERKQRQLVAERLEKLNATPAALAGGGA